MGLETATYLDDLDAANPVAGDLVAQGDDHFRLLKTVLKTTFPSFTRPFYHDTAEALAGDETLTTADDRSVKSVDASGGAVAIILPDSPSTGFEVTVIKSDASGNAVTITRAGSNTINGANTYVLSAQYVSAKVKYIGGGLWLVIAIAGAGSAGDVTGPASSVDGELALFDSTTGKLLKRASTTGLLKATSGVLGAAVSGTDYAPATTGSSVLKGNGSGGFTAATAGTDYVVPGGSLGTPSSGTLTNCTGLPQASVVGLTTSDSPSFAGLNLTGSTFGTPVFTIPNGNAYMLLGDRGVIQGYPSEGLTGTYFTHNAAHQGGTGWKNIANASISMLKMETGAFRVYIDTTPGAAGTVFTPTERFSISSAGNAYISGTLDLGHASANTLSASGGDLSIENTKFKKVGRESMWIPANAMLARTTNGAAAGSAEGGTNKVMYISYDFDATTQEFVQFQVRMPKSWDGGTVTAVFLWSHPATTTNFGVVWAIEGGAVSNDESADIAMGTAQTAADTGGTNGRMYFSPETSAMTIAGSPASEDWVTFQIKRSPSDGNDTMAVDARLHGVTLYFTTNASTDA